MNEKYCFSILQAMKSLKMDMPLSKIRGIRTYPFLSPFYDFWSLSPPPTPPSFTHLLSFPFLSPPSLHLCHSQTLFFLLSMWPSSPAPCSGNLSAQSGNYQASYIVQGSNVLFSISARTEGWVGIGVSDDRIMVSYVWCC